MGVSFSMVPILCLRGHLRKSKGTTEAILGGSSQKTTYPPTNSPGTILQGSPGFDIYFFDPSPFQGRTQRDLWTRGWERVTVGSHTQTKVRLAQLCPQIPKGSVRAHRCPGPQVEPKTPKRRVPSPAAVAPAARPPPGRRAWGRASEPSRCLEWGSLLRFFRAPPPKKVSGCPFKCWFPWKTTKTYATLGTKLSAKLDQSKPAMNQVGLIRWTFDSLALEKAA